MPKEPKTACVEDFSGDSDNGRTKPGTKISANIQKEKKKLKKDPKREKERSHRKERRLKSDDGTILDVEQTDDLVASFKRIRVLPDLEESGRRPANSAPVNGGHSPNKSSSRPQQGERRQSVTFEKGLPRHNKDDPSYFGRKAGEDVKYTPNKSSSSYRPRPPLAPIHRDTMHPPRPPNFHGPLPAHYPQQYPPQLPYASPMAFATPQPVDAYGGSYFAPATNRMADRFSRTGQRTLNDTPLPDMSAGRAQRQPQYYPEDDYEEDDYEEDDYDSEEEKRLAREEQQSRREKDLDRKARDIEHREQLLLEESERKRERDLIRLEESERLERERERELQKRIEDSMAMPPPSTLPRRSSSQRQRPYTPEVPTLDEIREQARRHKRNSRDAPEFALPRPKVTHHQTDPVRASRRPSFNTPSASSGGYDLHRRHRPDVLEVPGNRHSSFYTGTSGTGTSTTSSYYDEVERVALEHQAQVEREAPGLTEALLKKQQKTIAGSRSTRSTASRDESDYKRSVDTRTTRSGSGDGTDGLTLVINGTASMKINGAEVNTKESDGPVEISFNQPVKQIGNGSEVASESAYAPSRISGSTAVSDDFMDSSRPRPRNPRIESMSSHQSHSRQKPSLDNGRPPHSSAEQRLRDRMGGGPSLNRRNFVRGSAGRDYTAWP